MTNNAYVQSVLQQLFKPIRKDLDQESLVATMVDATRLVKIKGIKTVSIVGGAASGKSTIAEEFVAWLQKEGTRSDMLCTDNYVIGDREYRQQQLKDADALIKYNFALMDEHIATIKQLDNGQSIDVPVIDAKTGIAADMNKQDYDHQIGPVEVLVIEGDFPRDDYDLRFYIHVPDMQRLEANIEREVEANDADPTALTEAFEARQRTLHKPYTLPVIQDADYVVLADTEPKDWLYTIYQNRRSAIL